MDTGTSEAGGERGGGPDGRTATLERLRHEEFDLVVIGGGIFGAVTAWAAAVAGQRTALIEAGDFGSGSSANSYKVIHGGIRYVQHFDIPRVLSSCRERAAFLRIAPHLCEPLPIVIPTYGWGKLGIPFLGAGCALYDLITLGRNRGITDPDRRIPFTRLIGRERVMAEFPGIESEGLTGACIFNDGRFYNPTRLVWAFCDDLRARGGAVLNYCRASALEREGRLVTAVEAEDGVGGESLSIRTKAVVNASGPWAEKWLADAGLARERKRGTYSRDACFVVRNKLGLKRTLAVQSATGDPDALLAREKRHLFISPWRDDYLLVGVWHKVTDGVPERLGIEREELAAWIEELRGAYPKLGIELEDVIAWNCGLVPFGDEQKSDVDLSYGKRTDIIDHGPTDGIDNLVTLIGLRYTMARAEGEKALGILRRRLGWPEPDAPSDRVALRSAGFDTFEGLRRGLRARAGEALPPRTIDALARNHGADAGEILDRILADPASAAVFDNTTVTAAEVAWVCEREAIETLADVVLRRTDIATGENPGAATIAAVAAVVARCKGWDEGRRRREIEALAAHFSPDALLPSASVAA